MPLQIAPPMLAFPRLNILSYILTFGGLILRSAFLTPGAPRGSAGMPTRADSQVTRRGSAPTCGSWAWCCPAGTILSGVNFVTTII